MTEALSPEDQITNIIRALDEIANGPAMRYRMDIIRDTVAQLRDDWERYLRGELEPIPDDGLPF